MCLSLYELNPVPHIFVAIFFMKNLVAAFLLFYSIIQANALRTYVQFGKLIDSEICKV